MLKLYIVYGFFENNPGDSDFSHYILAYNECHAVNLFYRFFDLQGLLNEVRHSRVQELDVIHPKYINDHEKAR